MPRSSFALPLLLIAGAVHAEIAVEERSLSAPAPRPVAASAAASATPAGTAVTPAAAPAAGSLWDQYQQIQQLQQQIGQLQGMVEQQGFLIEKLQNDLRVRYTDLDQRLTQQQEQLQQRQLQDAATASVAAGAATMATGNPAILEEEKKAYLAAYDTFRAGGPDKAIPPMLAFVKRYPKSSFVPGAHYWLGEFYLNASTPDHDAAQRQFDIVLADYPDSPKAAAALYKSAAILDLKGKPDDARKKMLELKQKYPESPEAGLADNYLQALEAASAPAKEAPKPAATKAAAKPSSKAKPTSAVSKKN